MAERNFRELSPSEVANFMLGLELTEGLDGRGSEEYAEEILQQNIDGEMFVALTTLGRLQECIRMRNPFHFNSVELALELSKAWKTFKVRNDEHRRRGGELLLGEMVSGFEKRLRDKFLELASGNVSSKANIGNFEGEDIGSIPNAFSVFLSILIHKKTRVKRLVLSRNNLSSPHLEALATVIFNTKHLCEHLKELDVSQNRIRQTGVIGLCSTLSSTKYALRLAKLDLSKNMISDVGASAVGKLLSSNKTLTSLDLSNQKDTFQNSQGANDIGEAGSIAIAEGIGNNRVLRSLNLSHCRVGLEGIKWLVKSLRNNTSLVRCKLFYCHCGVEGVLLLRSAFNETKTLQYVDVRGNGVHPRDRESFQKDIEPYLTLSLGNKLALLHVLFDNLSQNNRGLEEIFFMICAYLRRPRYFLVSS